MKTLIITSTSGPYYPLPLHHFYIWSMAMPYQSTALSQHHVTSHAPNSIAFIIGNIKLDIRPLPLSPLSHVLTYLINPLVSNTCTPSISLPGSLHVSSSCMFNVGNAKLGFWLLYLICSPTLSFFSTTTLMVPMRMSSNTVNAEHEATP